LIEFAKGQNLQAPNKVERNLVSNFSLAPFKPVPSRILLTVKYPATRTAKVRENISCSVKETIV
jgi:hypothetical protein